jgi:hypothetical protein
MPSATIPMRASRWPLPLRIANDAHVRHCRAHMAQSCVRDLQPERLVRVHAQDCHRRLGLDFTDRWAMISRTMGGKWAKVAQVSSSMSISSSAFATLNSISNSARLFLSPTSLSMIGEMQWAWHPSPCQPRACRSEGLTSKPLRSGYLRQSAPRPTTHLSPTKVRVTRKA